MLALRKRPVHFLAAVIVLLLLSLYHRDPDLIYLRWVSALETLPEKLPANRTLGFGAVVAVSREGSDRRHSLLQAANVTDIELTIPLQPQWSERDLQQFRNDQEGVQIGSLLAWLGHLNVLRWFLDSDLETVLVLEDDVDFDIRLRSVQIPLAASAARSLLPPAKTYSPFAPFSKVRTKHTHYWGNPSSWDLLYLGHCGDYFGGLKEGRFDRSNRALDLNSTPHAHYRDPSLPPKSQLHPFTKELFDILGVHDHHRVFHPSKFPLCSFGYAVTRPAAERLLTDLAAPRLTPEGPRAFDVALLHACLKEPKLPSSIPRKSFQQYPEPKLQTKHDSVGLRCWTLNPELFHHMPGKSHIAQIEQSQGGSAGIPPVDAAAEPQIRERNETTNIDCGFWGGAFAFDDNDIVRLRFLQEHVGRRGKCLKRGKT